MMKILLQTQIHENYGSHDWDGTGKCPQYWKAKGGNDIEIDRELTWNEAADVELVKSLVKAATAKINRKSDHYEERVIDWELVTPDHLTWFEKSQLEMDGKILYPRTKISLAA